MDLRSFQDFKKDIGMRPVVLNPQSAHTKLAWPTHSSRTT